MRPSKQPPPAEDSWRKVPGRKDRVRWCGGHVGREHQPVVDLDHTLSGLGRCAARTAQHGEGLVWHCRHTTVCSVCGKILDLLGSNTPCPDKPAGMLYDFWKKRLNEGEDRNWKKALNEPANLNG